MLVHGLVKVIRLRFVSDSERSMSHRINMEECRGWQTCCAVITSFTRGSVRLIEVQEELWEH